LSVHTAGAAAQRRTKSRNNCPYPSCPFSPLRGQRVAPGGWKILLQALSFDREGGGSFAAFSARASLFFARSSRSAPPRTPIRVPAAPQCYACACACSCVRAHVRTWGLTLLPLPAPQPRPGGGVEREQNCTVRGTGSDDGCQLTGRG